MGPAVLFKIGKDHELIKVPIWRKGEPYENQDLALRDLQYHSKEGWTAHLIKSEFKE